ncbi:MAG: PQQ-binding-like beta-propeller repeat protein [Alphaproteobacteria bacterium]|nr:PQQ-binding-like beta-propeller repeat protein [Alphaproteobacteria bacterium]
MMNLFRTGCLAAMLLLSAGCSTLGLSSDDDKKSDAAKGKRESLMNSDQQLKPNAGVDGGWIKLPDTVNKTDWPQANGNALNAPQHAAVATSLKKFWRVSIGDGSGGALRLLARPVVAGGRVFTMDASGHVSAFALKDGEKLWRVSTQATESEASEAIGGGIAYDKGMLFATTGHAEVVALGIGDGKVLWRRKLMNPSRAAPTVADGRVYVVTINNATSVLKGSDGSVLWTHSGTGQTAALMGAASAAVDGDTAVVAYSSGEIFALRAQNGRVAWGDVLVSPLAVGALPEMADIRGAPVIDHGGVFALGHSGRMAALIMRSGERAWELDVGGSNPPLVAGNTIYLLSNAQKLMAVRRDNGKIIWANDLPVRVDADDRESTPIVWTGSLLAGGRLFLVNSHEELVEFDARTGKRLATHELPGASFIAPIAAQSVLFVVTEDGDLVAYR